MSSRLRADIGFVLGAISAVQPLDPRQSPATPYSDQKEVQHMIIPVRTTASDRGVAANGHPRRSRRSHDHRHTAWLRWQGIDQLTTEAQDFVTFALEWAPYGGPPHEETFLRFGMTWARFSERLWQLVRDAAIREDLSRILAAAYPSPGRTPPCPTPHRSRRNGTRRSIRAAAAAP
ncbi:hypothetical protein [Rhodococcus erythropolis]|uniref:hypothetical protein n=1 Tax=Rhodococcus erythropolis TaxID=1833 RepID=UPI0002EBB29E|nr:hypothetical protein [Rhodococcus erythropolis]